jgi:hypothetical protein
MKTIQEMTIPCEITGDGSIGESIDRQNNETGSGKPGRVEEESMTFVQGSAEYWLHRYYRTYVLPVIAVARGEKDLFSLHTFELKQKFLSYLVDDLKDIPLRHQNNCKIITETKTDVAGMTRTEYRVIPSLSALTGDEMKVYVLQCERMRDRLIRWRLPFYGDEMWRKAFSASQ